MTEYSRLADAVLKAEQLLSVIESGKLAEIDERVTAFFSESDEKYKQYTSKVIKVEGTADTWYPVQIKQPNGKSFSISRGLHYDEEIYGNFNGFLKLNFRAQDSGYGNYAPYFLFDLYFTGGNRKTNEQAGIPFVGGYSNYCSPHDAWIWLRGNTTYLFEVDAPSLDLKVFYEPTTPVGSYSVAAPRPVVDGVGVSVPSIGYVRGEA